MSVVVKTSAPAELVAKIYKAIDDKQVDTWSYDKDGDMAYLDYSWKGLAWFRPVAGVDEVVFKILPPKDRKISKTGFGVYHGHLIAMLLTYFDNDFTTATASASATNGDDVG